MSRTDNAPAAESQTKHRKQIIFFTAFKLGLLLAVVETFFYEIGEANFLKDLKSGFFIKYFLLNLMSRFAIALVLIFVYRQIKNSQAFRNGALAGIGIVFTTIAIAQVVSLGEYWSVFLLMFAVIGALIFGVPAGGIGGLIFAKLRNNNEAAYIGGAIAGVILAPFLFVLFSYCGFLGGC